DGKLLGRELDFIENVGGEGVEELLSTAVNRIYFSRGEQGLADLPREVLLPNAFEDRPTIETMLSERAGRRVSTHVPVRGDKLRLIELANQNARHLLEERAVLSDVVDERADDALYALQEAIEMKVVTRFIVCFDISHMQGTKVVASCVAFENGA